MESTEPIYEQVYTITNYYDGILSGIADFQGSPHFYDCPFSKLGSGYEDYFLLRPIDDETFRLALEDWEIWSRWWYAIKSGTTTQNTHPALPEDRARHDQIKSLLAERLITDNETDIRAYAKFRRISNDGYAGSPSGKFEVIWSVIPTSAG